MMKVGPISLRAMYGLGLLFVGLIVLVAQHSGRQEQVAEVAVPAKAAVEAPASSATAVAPAADTKARQAARQAWRDRETAQIAPLLGQWTTALNLADAAAPEQLQPHIAELQDIRLRLRKAQLSENCMVQAQHALGVAMDAHITYFIALKEQWPTVAKRHEEAEQAEATAKSASAECHA